MDSTGEYIIVGFQEQLRARCPRARQADRQRDPCGLGPRFIGKDDDGSVVAPQFDQLAEAERDAFNAPTPTSAASSAKRTSSTAASPRAQLTAALIIWETRAAVRRRRARCGGVVLEGPHPYELVEAAEAPERRRVTDTYEEKEHHNDETRPSPDGVTTARAGTATAVGGICSAAAGRAGPAPGGWPPAAPAPHRSRRPFAQLRVGQLHAQGILTDEEFAAQGKLLG